MWPGKKNQSGLETDSVMILITVSNMCCCLYKPFGFLKVITIYISGTLYVSCYSALLLQSAKEFVCWLLTLQLFGLRFISFALQLRAALEAPLPEDMEADLQYLAFQKQTEGFLLKITAWSFIQNESRVFKSYQCLPETVLFVAVKWIFQAPLVII